MLDQLGGHTLRIGLALRAHQAFRRLTDDFKRALFSKSFKHGLPQKPKNNPSLALSRHCERCAAISSAKEIATLRSQRRVG
jgi:hypothetical protein